MYLVPADHLHGDIHSPLERKKKRKHPPMRSGLRNVNITLWVGQDASKIGRGRYQTEDEGDFSFSKTIHAYLLPRAA